ncbi:MAG: amidinotransferase [Bacteroidia bacterium]|nr:amidinotransferase [Bacteroidia bacterium]
MQIQINNEYSKLKTVVLGIANNTGGQPHLDDAYDPKTKEFIKKGIYPLERHMIPEMEAFAQLLENYNVEVLRPNDMVSVNQIFTRDICFAIGDKLVIPEIIRERKPEQVAIQKYIDIIPEESVLKPPKTVHIEGGDVVVHGDYVFVGYSDEQDFYNFKTARTNEEGLTFLQNSFPDKKVIGFQLKKSDYAPMENALHLDCCFQPLGLGHVLLFEDGFQHQSDLDQINTIFGEDKMIKVSRDEMYNMNCNVFSIDKDVVVSERGFIRINEKLRSLGYTVEEVPYYQISKQEGLLRCSTLPLLRSND